MSYLAAIFWKFGGNLFFYLVRDERNSNCRLPVPRPGQVLGLVGTNGIGKSTALKVLAGKLKPNLGRFTVRARISLFFYCRCVWGFYCINLIFLFLCRTHLIGRKFWPIFEDLNCRITLLVFLRMIWRWCLCLYSICVYALHVWCLIDLDFVAV